MRHVALLLLCSIIATPLLAADRQWGFVRSGADAILFYGIPDSHDVTLNIICEPSAKRIRLVGTLLPPQSRQGAALAIELSNGPVVLRYDGKVGRDRTHGVPYIAARPRYDAQLFDVLRTGTALAVEVSGKRWDIPLKGVLPPLARMEQACLRRK